MLRKRRTINFGESELEANRDCEIDNQPSTDCIPLTVLILKAYVNSTYRLPFHKQRKADFESKIITFAF